MSSTDGNRSDKRLDRRSVLKTAGAAGVVGLAGCLGGGGGGGDGGGDGGDGGGDGGSTATDTPTPGSSMDDPITIGAVHPLTGPYGALAEFQQQGLELAVQAINDEGMLDREVQSIHEDSQLDPQTGKQKARKLLEDDGADMLTGAISSSVAIAIHEFAAEENVPYMAPGAANSMTMSNCKRTTFRYEMRAQQTGVATAPWAVEKFGSNVWIHNADYAWGNSVGNAWKAQAEGAGASIEGHTKSELGATDFSSYISQIASSDADWVATGINGGDAVNFLKQAESYGLKGNVDIVSPTNAFQFIRKAAGGAAQDTYATIRYYENFDNPANADFVSMFANEYGRPPDNFAHVVWVHAFMYAKAVAQAGTTETDPIVDALEQVSFDGPMGDVIFRECDHQVERPVQLGKIVAPDQYDWPDVEIETTVEGGDAMLPCGETGCSM